MTIPHAFRRYFSSPHKGPFLDRKRCGLNQKCEKTYIYYLVSSRRGIYQLLQKTKQSLMAVHGLCLLAESCTVYNSFQDMQVHCEKTSHY